MRSAASIRAKPWRLFVVLCIGAIAGCAAQDSSRSIDSTYARPAVAPAAPVAPSPASGPAGPAARVRGESTAQSPALSPAPVPRISGQIAPVIQSAETTGLTVLMAVPADRDSLVKPAVNQATIPAPSTLVMPLPAATYPIDLATALRLADVSNPTIGAARTLILEALALQLTARTLLLPSLNSGVTYRGHNGVLQRVSGKIIDNSLQQLYVGSGVGPFGSSGTATLPGVNIFCQLTDAWFEPLAARQRVAGTRFGRRQPRTIFCSTSPCSISSCWATNPSSTFSAFRRASFIKYISSRKSMLTPVKGERQTHTVPCRNGNGGSHWFRKPRKTSRSRRPGSLTASILILLCGSSRSVGRWCRSSSCRSQHPSRT